MTESPTRDHNMKARAGLIIEACRRIINLEEQRKALSQDIAGVKNKIVKGDLGMKISDFNISLRVYRLEGDDRATLFDTLQECFAALKVGAQLNFLEAIGAPKTTVAPAAEAAAKPPKRARGKKNPTPEALGEKVNAPHQPIDNIDEGNVSDEAQPVVDEHEDVDNPNVEDDEPSERDDNPIPDSLRRVPEERIEDAVA